MQAIQPTKTIKPIEKNKFNRKTSVPNNKPQNITKSGAEPFKSVERATDSSDNAILESPISKAMPTETGKKERNNCSFVQYGVFPKTKLLIFSNVHRCATRELTA